MEEENASEITRALRQAGEEVCVFFLVYTGYRKIKGNI